jgi:hypothetical protein
MAGRACRRPRSVIWVANADASGTFFCDRALLATFTNLDIHSHNGQHIAETETDRGAVARKGAQEGEEKGQEAEELPQFE